ncbi:unnamed protein product [Amoebophrya sp. A25]|nr:unnamed protein product [Amoebophrya sp. A25]|eukprot:GSA25T00019480001.1
MTPSSSKEHKAFSGPAQKSSASSYSSTTNKKRRSEEIAARLGGAGDSPIGNMSGRLSGAAGSDNKYGPPILHHLRRVKDRDIAHDRRKEYYEQSVLPELKVRASQAGAFRSNVRASRANHEDTMRRSVHKQLMTVTAERNRNLIAQEKSRQSFNSVILDLKDIFADHHHEEHYTRFSRVSETGSLHRARREFHAALKATVPILKDQSDLPDHLFEKVFKKMEKKLMKSAVHTSDDEERERYSVQSDDASDEVKLEHSHFASYHHETGEPVMRHVRELQSPVNKAGGVQKSTPYLSKKAAAAASGSSASAAPAQQGSRWAPPATQKSGYVHQQQKGVPRGGRSSSPKNAAAGRSASPARLLDYIDEEEERILMAHRAAKKAAKDRQQAMATSLVGQGPQLASHEAGALLPPKGLVIPPPEKTMSLFPSGVLAAGGSSSPTFLNATASLRAAATSKEVNDIKFEVNDSIATATPRELRDMQIKQVMGAGGPPMATPLLGNVHENYLQEQSNRPVFMRMSPVVPVRNALQGLSPPHLDTPLLNTGTIIDKTLFDPTLPRRQGRTLTRAPAHQSGANSVRYSFGADGATVVTATTGERRTPSPTGRFVLGQTDVFKRDSKTGHVSKNTVDVVYLDANAGPGGSKQGSKVNAFGAITGSPQGTTSRDVVKVDETTELVENGETLYVKRAQPDGNSPSISYHRLVHSGLLHQPVLLSGVLGQSTTNNLPGLMLSPTLDCKEDIQVAGGDSSPKNNVA